MKAILLKGKWMNDENIQWQAGITKDEYKSLITRLTAWDRSLKISSVIQGIQWKSFWKENLFLTMKQINLGSFR